MGSRDSAPAVISYLRFSTPEQIKGDSKRRQNDLADRWCNENNLQLSEAISDLGVSAFRGKNSQSGGLGTFLLLVQEGKIKRGSILLVEELDRISRQQPEDSISLFLAIIKAGIVVVTLNTGDRFETGQLNAMKLMLAVLKFCSANDESQKKSTRLSAAWSNKRANGKSKPVTAMVPEWLRVEDGKIRTVPEKVARVKEIFAMALKGYGLWKITRTLNGRGDRIGRSYVAKILHNRAVLGEFQPHKLVYIDNKRTRQPIGKPIDGYYPKVIKETVFLAVQNGLRNRKNMTGPTGSFVNLFSGLIKNAGDGATITSKNFGYGRKYVSSAVLENRKGAAKSSGFPLEIFDKAILIRLTTTDWFATPEAVSDTYADIEVAKDKLAILDKKIAEISEAAISTSSVSVVNLLTTLDHQRADAQKHLEMLMSQTPEDARAFIERLRARARDLPFADVGDSDDLLESITTFVDVRPVYRMRPTEGAVLSRFGFAR
jgi:DNA invertase Pin-like site-specific DNA recombinase